MYQSLQEILRKIPSVDELLSKEEIKDLSSIYPRPVIVEAIRRGLGILRREILEQSDPTKINDHLFTFDYIFPIIKREISMQVQTRLRPLINATGVVIHTNLGRAPLHPEAIKHMVEVSKGYSNLEYDLKIGERGDRHSHVEEVLCRLTGAESAMVVNNNAGAVLLSLNTIAEGREVIISRGELVEIGGSFRIPDVMRRSGAILHEVGTTNRTYLGDYKRAIGPNTALLLKVHTSNFRVIGFTSEVSLEELVQLGEENKLPVMEDLGSGCLIELERFGLGKEPTVQEAIKTGVDLITFSGDKLLGGPQAGIILGKKDIIESVKKNPLTRALRIDKLTLASLESTLLIYLDQKRAIKEIPVLRMLTTDIKLLKARGRRLMNKLSKKMNKDIQMSLKEDISQVGGGALPLQKLPTVVLSIKPLSFSVNTLEEKLRMREPPIISRIQKNELILDMRTVSDEEIPSLASGIQRALGQILNFNDDNSGK